MLIAASFFFSLLPLIQDVFNFTQKNANQKVPFISLEP